MWFQGITASTQHQCSLVDVVSGYKSSTSYLFVYISGVNFLESIILSKWYQAPISTKQLKSIGLVKFMYSGHTVKLISRLKTIGLKCFFSEVRARSCNEDLTLKQHNTILYWGLTLKQHTTIWYWGLTLKQHNTILYWGLTLKQHNTILYWGLTLKQHTTIW